MDGKLYRVLYEDGDKEDYDETELQQFLVVKKETDHYGVASDALDKNLNESVSQVGSSDTTAATAFDTSAENDDMPAVIKRESVLLSIALIKEIIEMGKVPVTLQVNSQPPKRRRQTRALAFPKDGGKFHSFDLQWANVFKSKATQRMVLRLYRSTFPKLPIRYIKHIIGDELETIQGLENCETVCLLREKEIWAATSFRKNGLFLEVILFCVNDRFQGQGVGRALHAGSRLLQRRIM